MIFYDGYLVQGLVLLRYIADIPVRVLRNLIFIQSCLHVTYNIQFFFLICDKFKLQNIKEISFNKYCFKYRSLSHFQGEEYIFEQDWGEQLVGKKKTVIAQYDIKNDSVKILEGIPENVCVAQPKYAPDGSHIVGVAYFLEYRKLGLIYCSNRPSTVFKLDFDGNYGMSLIWHILLFYLSVRIRFAHVTIKLA